MTLIEVMIAITILSVAALGLAGFMVRLSHAVAVTDVRNTANELASQRLEDIRNAPRYGAIDSLYPGTVNLAGTYAGYSRQTVVSHTGGNPTDLYDYRTITVIVRNGRIMKPVRRTTIVAAY